MLEKTGGDTYVQYRPVLTKRQGIALWHAGAFGNKLRTWTFKGWYLNSYTGEVGLRYADPRGGGACFEAHLTPGDAVKVYNRWIREEKRRPECVIVCEEAPDHRLLINGELLLDHTWTFYHSRVKKPMRAALREGGRYMSGLRTRETLRALMTPSSWSDLEALEDLYPGHVVELSVYDLCLGQCPGRNTIIWEVRKY